MAAIESTSLPRPADPAAAPPAADGAGANPHVEIVRQDVADRAAWAKRDATILKRRLTEREAKLARPYPGAPNPVEPIIDDTVREKTTQELSMMAGAPRLVTVLGLEPLPEDLRTQIEVGFDSFLRHCLHWMIEIEESLDTKNCRGFSPIQLCRRQDVRWGLIPDVEIVDPRDLIVPWHVKRKELQDADRITRVHRWSPRELRAKGRELGWRNVETLIERLGEEGTVSDSAGSGETSAAEETARLIGVSTSGGKGNPIVVWALYHYADAWTVAQDKTGRVTKGRKAVAVFCPDQPDLVLDVHPWREEPQVVELGPEEALLEQAAALAEGREPVLRSVVESDKDRPWPFIQARYENRSQYYYDTRGIGQLVMDNQLAATAVSQAKMIALDYFAKPLFKGSAPNSKNVTFEPGSILPDDLTPLPMAQIPQQFDFDLEMHRRTAGRRAGAAQMYQMSAQLSQTRKVQKTAAEVQEESARSSVVSSADVDRFNGPFAEVYQQLWEDCKRLRVRLPLIADDEFLGYAPEGIYGTSVLLVPAANAKTFNPDIQFARAQAAWTFAASMATQFAVPVDAAAAARDILMHWDPIAARRWLGRPGEALQPVHQKLAELEQGQAQLGQYVQAVGQTATAGAKLAEQVAARMGEGPAARQPGTARTAVPAAGLAMRGGGR